MKTNNFKIAFFLFQTHTTKHMSIKLIKPTQPVHKRSIKNKTTSSEQLRAKNCHEMAVNLEHHVFHSTMEEKLQITQLFESNLPFTSS